MYEYYPEGDTDSAGIVKMDFEGNLLDRQLPKNASDMYEGQMCNAIRKFIRENNFVLEGKRCWY